jgi:hypothetical protein
MTSPHDLRRFSRPRWPFPSRFAVAQTGQQNDPGPDLARVSDGAAVAAMGDQRMRRTSAAGILAIGAALSACAPYPAYIDLSAKERQEECAQISR